MYGKHCQLLSLQQLYKNPPEAVTDQGESMRLHQVESARRMWS